MKYFSILRSIIISAILLISSSSVFTQTTGFTYQGKLSDSSVTAPANGSYDMQFRLWDDPSAGQGTPLSPTTTIQGVPVVGGIFTVELNFGQAVFSSGAGVYLEISIRPAGNSGGYTSLAPRQRFTSSPYAIQSLNSTTAVTANNSSQLGGIAADQFVLTADPRMTDDRKPLAGSPNYIQNGLSVQSASNFNVSGTGTAAVLNAGSEFRIGNSRVLTAFGPNSFQQNTFVGLLAGPAATAAGHSNTGVGTGSGNGITSGNRNSFFGFYSGASTTTGGSNTFVGMFTGGSNTTGTFNSFVGDAAGYSNTTGTNNAFFGGNSGAANTTGGLNAFFGMEAGYSNTTASGNSFYGASSGRNTTTGASNSFFGYQAGLSNIDGIANAFFGTVSGLANLTGSYNSFFGYESGMSTTTAGANAFYGSAAGRSNTTGGNNAYFGADAGRLGTTSSGNAFFGTFSGNNNSTGTNNTFLGQNSGSANTTGSSNTLVGSSANVATANLSFATAIGAGSSVAASNTLVLGRAADTVQVPGSLNVAGTFGANIFNALTQYNIAGNRMLSAGGTNNIFAGNGAGIVNTGQSNAFFGALAGNDNTSGSFNSFFGFNAGAANTTAINNSFFGQGAGFRNTTGQNNAFIGNSSGLNNLGASNNTFLGSLSGETNVSGANNTFLGFNSGHSNNGGGANTFVGASSGNGNIGSSSNTFVGANAGDGNLTGNGNTYIGANSEGAVLITNSVAIGQKSYVGQSDTVVLGSIANVNGASTTSSVGIGVATPAARLHVKDNSSTNVNLVVEGTAASGAGIELRTTAANGARWLISTDGQLHFTNQNEGADGEVLTLLTSSASNGNGFANVDGDLSMTGTLTVGILANGQNTSVCWNSINKFIGTCSSSVRYKKDLHSFSRGLDLLNRLDPVTFIWKSDNSLDLGFAAEDVAKAEPLLATYNADGQVEGVKYDRISAVLVNAVKEQQLQIELLQKQVTELKNALAGHLKAVKKTRVTRGKKYGKQRQ